MILVVLSTHAELASATARGRLYWETGEFKWQMLLFCDANFAFFLRTSGQCGGNLQITPGGGGALVFQVGYHPWLSKHTLSMYFSGMKIDPKYMFLHAFFLICPSCPFQNLLTLSSRRAYVRRHKKPSVLAWGVSATPWGNRPISQLHCVVPSIKLF